MARFYDVTSEGYIQIASPLHLPRAVAELLLDHPDVHHIDLALTDEPGAFLPVLLAEHQHVWWTDRDTATGRLMLFVVNFNEIDRNL